MNRRRGGMSLGFVGGVVTTLLVVFALQALDLRLSSPRPSFWQPPGAPSPVASPTESITGLQNPMLAGRVPDSVLSPTPTGLIGTTLPVSTPIPTGLIGTALPVSTPIPTGLIGTALPVSSSMPAGLSGTAPLVANPTPVGTAHPVMPVVLDIKDNLYSDERVTFELELNRAQAAAIDQVGPALKAPITVQVIRDPSCILHSVSYPKERTFQAYTCPFIRSEQVVALAARGFVHQLAYDRYGQGARPDPVLVDGVAIWGAQHYWLAGEPDLRTLVRRQREAGVFYALTTDPVGQGDGVVNALSYEWASFVDYLLSRYGWPAFSLAYTSGDNAPGSADYQLAYGKSLPTLEQEWLAWLTQQATPRSWRADGSGHSQVGRHHQPL